MLHVSIAQAKTDGAVPIAKRQKIGPSPSKTPRQIVQDSIDTQSEYLVHCALSMEKHQTVTTDNGLIIPAVQNINFADIQGIGGRRVLFNFNACDYLQNCQMQDVLRALSLTIGSSMSNYPELQALLRRLYTLPGASSKKKAPMSWSNLLAACAEAGLPVSLIPFDESTWQRGKKELSTSNTGQWKMLMGQLLDIFVTFAQGRCAVCGTLFVGGEGDKQRVLVGSEGDHILASTKSLNPKDLCKPNQTYHDIRLAELFDNGRKVCESSRCHPRPVQ